MCFKETKIPKRRRRSNASLIPRCEGEKRCQIGRPLRPEIQLGTRDRVAELKPGGMQRLPWRKSLKRFGGSSLSASHTPTSPGSIDGIAYDGVAHMGEVHPDLMGATGVKRQSEQINKREASNDLGIGSGEPAFRRHDDALSVPRVAGQRRLDHQRALVQMPPAQGGVAPGDSPRREHRTQAPVTQVGLSDDHQPGGVAIQAVHDARPARRAAG